MSSPSLLHRALAVIQGFNRGDWDVVEDHLDEDVVWHGPHEGSIAGTFRGRAEVLSMLRRFRENIAGTVRIEPVDVLVGDSHVMAINRLSATVDGTHREVLLADAMRFSGGRLTEYWTLANDRDTYAAITA